MRERTFEEIQEIRQDVASRYADVTFPDIVLEPVWWGRRPENRVDEHYAIVDQNTNKVFNICTEKYKPVYHELIIHNVEQAAVEMPQFGVPKIKVDMIGDGAKMRVNVMFPEVDYMVKSGDIFHPTSDIKTSYDLGWKYTVDFGAYRLVCSNGLKVGEVFESFKKRHMTGLDPNILSETLNAGMLRFDEQTQLWQKWAEKAIPHADYETIWEELPFSKPEREKIEAITGAGNNLILAQEIKKDNQITLWDMFNNTTQYVTHNINSVLRRVEIGPEITRVFERAFHSIK
jgi:hypothetical protein